MMHSAGLVPTTDARSGRGLPSQGPNKQRAALLERLTWSRLLKEAISAFQCLALPLVGGARQPTTAVRLFLPSNSEGVLPQLTHAVEECGARFPCHLSSLHAMLVCQGNHPHPGKHGCAFLSSGGIGCLPEIMDGV